MNSSEITDLVDYDNVSLATFGELFTNLTNNSFGFDSEVNQTSNKYVRTWTEGTNMKIAMTCIYVIIFFCGILGNFVFCIVLLRNKVLHTATNIYLFSMSCSDLIVLFFGLPYDFNSLWTDKSYFPQKYSVFHSLLLESSTNASIITITIFTIERYIGICHPLRTQTMSLVERVPKIIVGIWLISFLLTIPLITFHPSSYEGEKTYNPYAANAFITLSFVCLFSIPMVLITILYVRIILELKQSERISNVKSCRGESAIKAGSKSSKEMVARNRDVIKMLVAVVASFFLCFSPLQCQRLISVFGDEQRETVFMTMRVLTHLSGIFHYLSTCINPILYHIMSDRFRKAMKATFCCVPQRRFHFSSTSRQQWGTKSRVSSYQSSRTTKISEIPSSIERPFVEEGSKTKIETEPSSSTSLMKWFKSIRESSVIPANYGQDNKNKERSSDTKNIIIAKLKSENQLPHVAYVKSNDQNLSLREGTACKHRAKLSGKGSESITSTGSISNCSMLQKEDDESTEIGNQDKVLEALIDDDSSIVRIDVHLHKQEE